MQTQTEKHIIELCNTAIEICNKNTSVLNELSDAFEKRLRFLKMEVDNQALQIELLSKRADTIGDAIDVELQNTGELLARLDRIEQALTELNKDTVKQGEFAEFRDHFNLL